VTTPGVKRIELRYLPKPGKSKRVDHLNPQTMD